MVLFSKENWMNPKMIDLHTIHKDLIFWAFEGLQEVTQGFRAGFEGYWGQIVKRSGGRLKLQNKDKNHIGKLIVQIS